MKYFVRWAGFVRWVRFGISFLRRSGMRTERCGLPLAILYEQVIILYSNGRRPATSGPRAGMSTALQYR